MKIGSHKHTLFAQGSALGWELFGPRGADAQGVALGLSQSFFLLLDDAPASQVAAMKIAGIVRLATRHFLWNQGAIQRFRLTTENTESTEE